ncbi:MAG: hypothetical protein ACTSYZ_16020 [Candidatus Helarchaeota archaeon]
MDFIRKIFWASGIIIIIVTIINFISSIINIQWTIFWIIIGALLIICPELYFFLRKFFRVRSVGEILDQHPRITENQLLKFFEDKPAFKILPVFRNYKKGIIVLSSGRYIHYNNQFIDKFINEYNKTSNLSKLSENLKLSKTEIRDIIKKLQALKILRP